MTRRDMLKTLLFVPVVARLTSTAKPRMVWFKGTTSTPKTITGELALSGPIEVRDKFGKTVQVIYFS